MGLPMPDKVLKYLGMDIVVYLGIKHSCHITYICMAGNTARLHAIKSIFA